MRTAVTTASGISIRTERPDIEGDSGLRGLSVAEAAVVVSR
jgi:hypothetical protein